MRVWQWQTAKPVAFHLAPVITNKVEVGVSRSVPNFPFCSRCFKWKGRSSSKQGWDSLLEKVLLAVLWMGFCWAEGVVFLAQGDCKLDFSLMEQPMGWSRASPEIWFALVLGTEQKMSLVRVSGPAPETETQFILCEAGAWASPGSPCRRQTHLAKAGGAVSEGFTSTGSPIR